MTDWKGVCRISKKFEVFYYPLPMYFLYYQKYYYENRLISKPALRISWNWIRSVIRGCMQISKKIRRLLLSLAYVFFTFTMKYYYENRLISAKPALRFSWNLGSCNRRVIRGCVQNFKKIRRLLLPLAYVIRFFWNSVFEFQMP